MEIENIKLNNLPKKKATQIKLQEPVGTKPSKIPTKTIEELKAELQKLRISSDTKFELKGIQEKFSDFKLPESPSIINKFIEQQKDPENPINKFLKSLKKTEPIKIKPLPEIKKPHYLLGKLDLPEIKPIPWGDFAAKDPTLPLRSFVSDQAKKLQAQETPGQIQADSAFAHKMANFGPELLNHLQNLESKTRK
jgi:hypothetical protein